MVAKKNKEAVKKERFYKKLLSYFNFRAYLAEFVGTFVFVFIACGSVLISRLYGELDTLSVALAAGLSLGAVSFATAPFSRANLNPVITSSLWLVGRLKTLDAFMYLVFQIAASFAAAGLLLGIFGQKGIDFLLGGPEIGIGFSLQTALIVEAVVSAFLVFVYFATMLDEKLKLTFAPFAIGAVYIVGVLFATTISGGALNPARAIGSLVIAGKFENLIVWIFGPLVAALVGVLYHFVFSRK